MSLKKGSRGLSSWVVLLGCGCLLLVMCGCERVPGGSGRTTTERRELRVLRDCQTMKTLLPGTGSVKGLSGPARSSCFILSDMFSLVGDEASTCERFGALSVLQVAFKVGTRKLEVRLFDVQSPARAHALCLWFTPTDAETIPVGMDGCVTDEVLRCWKGKHLLEVRGSLNEAELKTVATALAGHVAAAIKESGQPSPLVVALKKVLVKPAPTDVKIVYSEAELMKASVAIPYYSGVDILSLEKYEDKHPVEAALASVFMSEATPGQTIFFLIRYPREHDATLAFQNYRKMADADPNVQLKQALLVRKGMILAGVWRPVPGAEALLGKILAELK